MTCLLKSSEVGEAPIVRDPPRAWWHLLLDVRKWRKGVLVRRWKAGAPKCSATSASTPASESRLVGKGRRLSCLRRTVRTSPAGGGVRNHLINDIFFSLLLLTPNLPLSPLPPSPPLPPLSPLPCPPPHSPSFSHSSSSLPPPSHPLLPPSLLLP